MPTTSIEIMISRCPPGTYFSAQQISFALERNPALLHSIAPEMYVESRMSLRFYRTGFPLSGRLGEKQYFGECYANSVLSENQRRKDRPRLAGTVLAHPRHTQIYFFHSVAGILGTTLFVVKNFTKERSSVLQLEFIALLINGTNGWIAGFRLRSQVQRLQWYALRGNQQFTGEGRFRRTAPQRLFGGKAHEIGIVIFL